jgi:hypothetical protein
VSARYLVPAGGRRRGRGLRKSTEEEARIYLVGAEDTQKGVEQWAAAQAEKPAFSVAIRLIVTEHLKAKGYLK